MSDENTNQVNLPANVTGKFLTFHSKNPQVYSEFKRYAFDLINAGVKHASVALIIERMRWDSALRTEGDKFKISNDYRADFARLFAYDFPAYADFFKTKSRTQVLQESIAA